MGGGLELQVHSAVLRSGVSFSTFLDATNFLSFVLGCSTIPFFLQSVHAIVCCVLGPLQTIVVFLLCDALAMLEA